VSNFEISHWWLPHASFISSSCSSPDEAKSQTSSSPGKPDPRADRSRDQWSRRSRSIYLGVNSQAGRTDEKERAGFSSCIFSSQELSLTKRRRRFLPACPPPRRQLRPTAPHKCSTLGRPMRPTPAASAVTPVPGSQLRRPRLQDERIRRRIWAGNPGSPATSPSPPSRHKVLCLLGTELRPSSRQGRPMPRPRATRSARWRRSSVRQTSSTGRSFGELLLLCCCICSDAPTTFRAARFCGAQCLFHGRLLCCTMHSCY
jgi:hypothetical protein